MMRRELGDADLAVVLQPADPAALRGPALQQLLQTLVDRSSSHPSNTGDTWQAMCRQFVSKTWIKPKLSEINTDFASFIPDNEIHSPPQFRICYVTFHLRSRQYN